MICMHCGNEFKEKDIEAHHIHPKFMDNKKGEGMQINLCRSCHNKLHLILPSLYWQFLNNHQKNLAIDLVKFYGKKWGNLK